MEVVKFHARALSRFFRSLVNTKGAATLQKLSLIHFFLKDLLMVCLKSEEYMHIACQFKKTFKTIFHLLNIVPLWISFKEENGVKNLQKKYFNSFFILSSLFAYNMYQQKNSKSKMGIFTFTYSPVISALLLLLF